MDHSDLIDTLGAMKRQDEMFYKTEAGLYDGSRMIDAKIRDTVSISTNMLDRYVARQPRTLLNDQRKFQLSAMGCLYTAIKIHEPEAMTPLIVANLSKGVYSESEIEWAERDILMSIEWRVNPPTAISFATNYLKLLPHLASSRGYIDDLVHRQVDFALKDAALLGITASAIAFAAVSNAILSLDPSQHYVSCQTISHAVGLKSVSLGLADTLSMGCGIETSRPRILRRLSKRNSSSGVHQSPRCITMNT